MIIASQRLANVPFLHSQLGVMQFCFLSRIINLGSNLLPVRFLEDLSSRTETETESYKLYCIYHAISVAINLQVFTVI